MLPHAEMNSMRAYLAGQCPHTAEMPIGLATLMGLRRVLPPLADRVRLEAARRYRQAEGDGPGTESPAGSGATS
jgi:hypothetical protein